MKPLVAIRWAIVERTDERSVDGRREFISWTRGAGAKDNASPLLFRTRREARAFIATNEAAAYRRPDLRAMGWLMPRPARCRVVIEAIE